MEKEIPSLYVSSTEEWRVWLNENGQTERKVFLISYHKNSKVPSISWIDAIEHALCYGWFYSRVNLDHPFEMI